jgi:superfamily II DNA/RNA helicase
VTVSQFHPAENVEQHVYFVEKNEKEIYYITIKNQDLSDVLVFSRTKHGADNVVKALQNRLQLRPYMVINLRMQDSECWRL